MTRQMISRSIPYSILIVAIFLADQLSKRWAAAYLADRGPATFGRYFDLVEAHNRGIGFGLFQGSGPVVGWLTIGIVVAMWIWMVRTPASRWITRLGIALIIGGALGNMVDRIAAGQVLDFISTPFWPRIFNIADVAIRGGVLVVILGFFVPREERSLAEEVQQQAI